MMRLFVLNEVERMMKIETIILKAIAGEIAWNQAAELLDLSPRQLRRKRKTYEEEGLSSLIDRRKGRSKKRKPKALIDRILALYKEEYWGFNVSHFHEELQDTTDIQVSYTWLKTLLQDKGYVTKERKRGKYHRRRERRPMSAKPALGVREC